MNGVTGTWKVKFSLEDSNIKLFPVQPETFSGALFEHVAKHAKQDNVKHVRPDPGSGREHILIGRAEFLCLYFIANYFDFFEFEKQDFAALREKFVNQFNSFYENVFNTFQDKINAEKQKDHKRIGESLHTVYNLKNFQIDLIREGVEKKGRFILNEKRIVGKRVIAYQIMKFFQDKSKKIVIIAAKKNTHHWRELICQWDDYVSKKNIILYKKENRIASLLKKQIIIVNDKMVQECIKDAPQLFNKSSNIIIDKEVECLEDIADKIKDYCLRVCYICQSFSKLKIGEKLALLTLFDCVKRDPNEVYDRSHDLFGQNCIKEEDCPGRSERKLENILIANNCIQKYFISLDDKKHYPEFDFKVHEKAFIINYNDEEIEEIKQLKNMVSSGNSEDIIRTYKEMFEKNDEDIRNMSKNLKGTFKNPERYFYNHSLESMKRAIDFKCTKLFAETKITHTKTIIERLILEGKKKIVVWAFHCNILQKIAAFISDLKISKGYKVLEVSSVMADDKRNEIIMEFNKLDMGFLIIPFSVKKERFKNLDFDVFLFVELTYNLEFYSTARKILYSPYLTKDKYLYIVLSPPADSYIWIKFETIYKRPEWEKCIKELKERGIPYVLQDLIVKDEKQKPISSELDQIKIQLEIGNEKLRIDNKKQLEKIREFKDKKKVNKRTNIYEIDPYINSLAEGQILPKEEERLFLEFAALNKVRIGETIYIKGMQQRKDDTLREALLKKTINIDNMDLPAPNKATLKAAKEKDEKGFRDIFNDRLDILPNIEKRVQLIEEEFDLTEMQSTYKLMIGALGKNNYGNLNNELYTKTVESMGYDVDVKDPTQCSKGFGTLKEVDQEENDSEFFEEFMNMLIGAYLSVTKNQLANNYYSSVGANGKESKTMESSFEKSTIEGMFDIRNHNNFNRVFAVIDRACHNPKLRELIKDTFRTSIKQSQEELKPKYTKIDLADQAVRSLKKEADIKKEGTLSLQSIPRINDDLPKFSIKQEADYDFNLDLNYNGIKLEENFEDHTSCMLFGNHNEMKDNSNGGGFLFDQEDNFLGKRSPNFDIFEIDRHLLSNDRDAEFGLDPFL